MTLPPLSPGQWCLAVIAALCVGLAKGGFVGIGLFTIILMAEIAPARESTGLVLPLLICGDVFAVLMYRRHAQWKHIFRTLPVAMAGVVLGWIVMPRIPADSFRKVIGWILLTMIALQFLQRLRPNAFRGVLESRGFGWSMGAWSGFTTMLANAAGPVMTLYLLAVNLPKLEFVGTGAWFFLVINAFKVPFSWQLGLIGGTSLALNLVLVPAVLAGLMVGRRLIALVPQKQFEGILLVLAALASLRLVAG
ncbi:MAG TPA: sulfite exporter TauE/SafE family protein [Planctomycetota bacterium]|jgi:uncharacterized membrane protein YfcA|nr:sulfite exporter TauE/SafE family protein [Planctomycetota bacterium]